MSNYTETFFSVDSGFYDSVGRDRVYSADDMNQPYKGILSEGIIQNGNGLKVVKAGTMKVTVNAGRALLGGKWVDVSSTQITIGAASLAGRIDSIILRVDNNDDVRAANLIYRQGTPDISSPSAPDLDTSTGITEVRLANISIAASASDLGTITDTRGGSECAWVSFLVGEAQIESALMEIITEHPELITAVPDGGITTAKLASLAVTTEKINYEAVTTDKLADSAVTSDKLDGSSVTEEKIAFDSVNTAIIKNGAVTTVKIADDAVTIDKLKDFSVVEGKLCVTYTTE